MADIFISYSKKDRARVRVLADALAAHGWSVWWDRQIRAGRTFDQVIAEALANARCVVVVWSKESTGSSWVRDEAEEGRRRDILIPVLIDEGRPPLGFGRIQAVDLADWNGDAAAETFQKLIADIASIVGPPAAHAAKVAASPPVVERQGRPDTDVAAAAVTVTEGQGETVPATARESRRARGVFGARDRGAAVRWSIVAVLVLAVLTIGLYRVRTSDDAAGSLQPRATTTPSEESALRLNAVMNEGGDPLTTGVTYEVREVAADAEGNRRRVTGSPAYDGPPRFQLPAGRYYVTARYGNASASTEVDVRATSLALQTLNLRAGVLVLSSRLADASPPLETGVRYEVYGAATDVEGNRKRIVSSPAYDPPPRFPLPAGRYYVMAAYGSASATAEIDLSAGEIKPQALGLGAGILGLSTVIAAGRPALTTGVRYTVFAATQDVEGKRKQVVSSPAYDPPPRFPLPAGRYYVTAEYGSAATSAEIDIAAGQVNPQTLNLHAGILNLSTNPPLAKGVRYIVYEAARDVEGRRKQVVASPAYDPPPRISLSAGRYYVAAEAEGRKADSEVTVSEGQVHQVALRLRGLP